MLKEEREGAVNLSTPPKELFHAPIEIIHRCQFHLRTTKPTCQRCFSGDIIISALIVGAISCSYRNNTPMSIPLAYNKTNLSALLLR